MGGVDMSRGVTLEAGTLKVLKAVAELEDMRASDLLQWIVTDAFDGKVSFSGKTLQSIERLKVI